MSRDATKALNFYGNAKAVLAQLDPWLDLGVTDVLFYSTAGMGGSRFAPSCHEADLELQAALSGRPVRLPD